MVHVDGLHRGALSVMVHVDGLHRGELSNSVMVHVDGLHRGELSNSGMVHVDGLHRGELSTPRNQARNKGPYRHITNIIIEQRLVVTHAVISRSVSVC